MKNIFEEINDERRKQDTKWGIQNHKPIEWIANLTEEVGEASKAALKGHLKNCYWDLTLLKEYREELIQVVAVAVAMIESLERNNPEDFFLNTSLI